MSTEKSSNKKNRLLVPLATLTVAAAVVVGSGANWSSSTDSSISVESGEVVHTNSHDGATLTITDLLPGESASGALTITNTGSTTSVLDVDRQSGAVNNFGSTVGVDGTQGTADDVSDLHLTVDQDGTQIYTGNFEGWDGSGVSTAALDEGDTTTVQFTVSLTSNAPDTDQGKSASVGYTFTTQAAPGHTPGASWLP